MKNMHIYIGIIGLLAIIGCGYYLHTRSKSAENVIVQGCAGCVCGCNSNHQCNTGCKN